MQHVEYLSERKRKPGMRGDPLDPLGEQRQKCWQSPGAGHAVASSVSDENESGIAIPPKDFVKGGKGVTNIMNQDGGSNSQQISAAIIKKIQNNYQV